MHALLAKAQRYGCEVWLGPFLRDLNDNLPWPSTRPADAKSHLISDRYGR
jgi:hypothetical protein